MTANLDQCAEELDAAFDDFFGQHLITERWVRYVAEEAGEVVGAFNKWERKSASKPRTPEDILGESAQLFGNLLIVMRRLGFSSDDLFKAADFYMTSKAREIREARREGQSV